MATDRPEYQPVYIPGLPVYIPSERRQKRGQPPSPGIPSADKSDQQVQLNAPLYSAGHEQPVLTGPPTLSPSEPGPRSGTSFHATPPLDRADGGRSSSDGDSSNGRRMSRISSSTGRGFSGLSAQKRGTDTQAQRELFAEQRLHSGGVGGWLGRLWDRFARGE